MQLAHLHIEAGNGPLSVECVDRGIISYLSLMEWVEQLPYARNSDRADFSLVLEEEKGTCSTKHAFLKAVADENNWGQGIQLFMGIYKMSIQTNTEVGAILRDANLEWIPEAHTYLKVQGVVRDYTGLTSGDTSFEEVLILEKEIVPTDIGQSKLNFHTEALQKFADEQLRSLNEIKSIREKCIAAFQTPS